MGPHGQITDHLLQNLKPSDVKTKNSRKYHIQIRNHDSRIEAQQSIGQWVGEKRCVVHHLVESGHMVVNVDQLQVH